MVELKKILKYISFVVFLPITYFLLSLVLSYITINPEITETHKNSSIYLASDGVHLEIIIPKNKLDTALLNGLKQNSQENYLSFGWGDRTFYIKASTSSNFTFKNKLRAAFMNTPTLLHIKGYFTKQNDWVEIKITASQLATLQTYINNTFKKATTLQKIRLPDISYGTTDNFYEANGNYNCFNTCNTWVNEGLKQSQIKACLWTPFDFGLLHIHKN